MRGHQFITCVAIATHPALLMATLFLCSQCFAHQPCELAPTYAIERIEYANGRRCIRASNPLPWPWRLDVKQDANPFVPVDPLGPVAFYTCVGARRVSFQEVWDAGGLDMIGKKPPRISEKWDGLP